MVELPAVTQDLSDLLHLLDDGWKIEAPLLQRTVLHGANGGYAMLEAIIIRNGTRHFVALPDEPHVRRWLEERNLVVLPV